MNEINPAAVHTLAGRILALLNDCAESPEIQKAACDVAGLTISAAAEANTVANIRANITYNNRRKL